MSWRCESMTSIPTPRRAEAAGAEVTDATNHSMANANTPESTSGTRGWVFSQSIEDVDPREWDAATAARTG